MKILRNVLSTATLLAALTLLPSFASAQSSISGTAKDTTGAVMVGVSVEAASDALIEKSRTVTTDGSGRYAVADVRPGTYVVTFTMQGFATVKETVEVPANTTVTVDANMKPGAVGETISVEASVATVDVQNAAHPAVLSREDMDLVPTARNVQSIGSLVPGVHLNTPDVGGSMQVQQTYLTSHGNDTWHTIWMLDGILVNVMQSDGQIQAYIDNAIIQESTYQTSAIGADSQAGGVFVNMVPKEGGNQFHSDVFLGFVPGSFVGTNLTDLEQTRGLASTSTVSQIQDLDGSIGGPILKDKLWFLGTFRKQVSNLNAISFNGGSGGAAYAIPTLTELDNIYTPHLRLTWQIAPKFKASFMYHRMFKTIGGDLVSAAGSFLDANINSSNHRRPVMYYITQTRWTGTLTPKLIVQGGFGIEYNDYTVLNQAGVLQTPFTTGWYLGTSLNDSGFATRAVSGGSNNYYSFRRYAHTVTAQYITGTQQIKVGYMDSFGPAYQNLLYNGDSIYNYLNGVPNNVTAENTPISSKPYLDHDLGIFAIDTWNWKRLSVTGGIRFDYLQNHVNAESAPAGRWVPARSFARVDCNTVKGLGCFKDWAPRLGVVYDLFGDHKTALKFGIGKYDTPIVQQELNNFNPMFATTQTLTWSGAPTTACEVAPGQTLNGMSQANVNCIPGFTAVDGTKGGVGTLSAPSNGFGQLINRTLDPNFHREYNWQLSAGVQREIWRGVTLNWNWNHRKDYQHVDVINEAVPATPANWTATNIINPLDPTAGATIPVYAPTGAYSGAFSSISPILYQTNAPQSLATNGYNGFETSVNARLPRKISIFGGWSLDKQYDTTCDMPTTTSNINDPNTLRFCDMTGKISTVNGFDVQGLGKISGVPYRNEIKISGNVPVRWGIEAAISWYNAPVSSTNYTNQLGNYDGLVRAPAVMTGAVQGFYTANWSVSKTTRYPTDCTQCPNDPTNASLKAVVDPNLATGQTEVIQLIAPGTRFTPRINQLDVTFRRVFRFREKYTLSGEVTMFNIINQSTAITETETIGSNNSVRFMSQAQCTAVGNPTNCGIGGVPNNITLPRMFRVSTQFKF